MSMAMVMRLIWKDWYLNRAGILISLIGGMATLGLVAASRGSKIAVILGLIIVATILIGMGAMVMSLPISYWEYTTAKIAGSLLIFLVLWTAMLADMVATILLAPGFAHGLIPFVVIMSVEILMSTCLVTAVAVTTESQGWTVGAAQVGALSLNGIGWWIVRFPDIGGMMTSATMRWSSTATALLTVELAAIALMIAITFFVQARKRDFV